MTLSVLAVLVVMSVAAGWSRRRSLARGMALFTVVLFLASACGPVPQWLVDNLQDGYSAAPSVRWSARNAIVLLAAGTIRISDSEPLTPTLYANGRIIEAMELYRSCKTADRQCLVLISGGDAQQHGTPESTVYAGVLTRLGVPAQDVQTETSSRNTFENARYSRGPVLVYDPQTLVLVTSGIHLRRSLLDFDHFGMKPLPVGADRQAATFSLWPLASNLQLCDLALHEYVGIAQFHLYEALGLNTMPVLGPVKPASAAPAAGGSIQNGSTQR
jgi:uncharacterized SAM-binding protein YcdF (DUF218 family)